MRLKVREIKPGMFSTERYVEFASEGKEYSLFVDQSSVSENDKTLNVQVVEAKGEKILVELPRSTMTAGSRVFVAKAMLTQEIFV